MPAEKPRLTPKQKRFVEEYAASDGNAVQAYFRAFGRRTSKGHRRTYKGAQVEASRLLSNPIIQAELKAAEDEYVRRTRVSKLRVIREVAAIAFADPLDLYEPDEACGGLPKPRRWDEVPAATRRAVASVKIKRRRLRDKADAATEWEVEELEFKMAPKGPELDKLCKKLGFYADTGDQPKPGEKSVIVVEENGRDGPQPGGDG